MRDSPLTLLLLAAGSLVTGLCGQRSVWIVDSQGRPGSHFSDLPPAVAAAAPGDVLQVRDGQYTGFVTRKPLSILCQASALLVTPASSNEAIGIERIPAGSEFTLQGLAMSSGYLAYRAIRISDCAGRVLVERVVGGHRPYPDRLVFVTIARSSRVMIHEDSFVGAPGLDVEHSTVTMSDTTVDGEPAGFSGTVPYGGTPAVSVHDGVLMLSRCELRGGDGAGTFPPSPASPALYIERSVVAAAGDGSTAVRAGTNDPQSMYPVAGTGDLLAFDPARVPLIPHGLALPVEPGIPIATWSPPSVSASGASLGGQIAVDVYDEANDIFALLVGLPAGPSLTPLGPLWLALWPPPVTFATGLLDQTGRFASTVPVPGTPALLGATLTWQAIAGPSLPALSTSNPASLAIY